MSVADQITRIKNNIEATYTAAQAKGATMPQTQNSAGLASCIESIPSGEVCGLTATDVLGSIDENGILYRGVLPQPDFSGITQIGERGLYYKFVSRSFSANTSMTFSDLTTVSYNGMQCAFRGATGITSTAYPLLSVINRNGLQEAYSACADLVNASFPALTNIDAFGMESCFYMTSLATVSFPVLASLGNYAMAAAFSATQLASISFPALTNVQNNSFGDGANYPYAFTDCHKLTEIHFPASMQAQITAMQGYAEKWGASNATIYFDL